MPTLSSVDTLNLYQRIYAMVCQIPAGQVATYGDIAKLAHLPRHARMVGYALHALPMDADVPWQRVINAQGGISLRRISSEGALHQRYLLELEGVEFKENGKVDLKRFRWKPHQADFFTEEDFEHL